tara:strand:+ start:194 stop:397 length:204 start_codon:yes stop_codon:yes gene_type:complete
MEVVVMVMDLITHMVTTQVVDHTMVDHNPHHTTKVITLIDTKVILHGEQVEMDHSTATEVLVVDKVW